VTFGCFYVHFKGVIRFAFIIIIQFHAVVFEQHMDTTVTKILPQYETRMSWTGHVARMGESGGAYKVLVRKPGGRRPLGRPRCKWEDNIKMVFRDVEWGHELDRYDGGGLL
jgi:hypothetical protein